MVEQQKEYKVVITESAEKAFFEVLDYVAKYYGDKRTIEIASDLLQVPLLLKHFPERGALEKYLSKRTFQFRFILFKRTNDATIKIIYFIDEVEQTVFVIDYFPTEMNPLKMLRKNKS